MNLKEKIKNVFTWNYRCDKGFTLVELIVVIAILAILGGIAVPAYNGYVKKAEKAADEALLNEINMAFASACAINGESHIGLETTPKLDLNGKAVRGIKNTDTTIATAFNDFFESTEKEFGVFNVKKIAYNKESGAFENDPQRTYGAFSYNLGSKNDYSGSIWNDENRGLGTKVLLSSVDDIVDWANDKLNLNGQNSLVNDEDFMKFYEEWTEGINPADEDKAMTNALVMYTAMNSDELDRDALYSSLYSNGVVDDSAGGNGVSRAAIEYAVGMAYVTEMNKRISSGEVIPGYDSVIATDDPDAIAAALQPKIVEVPSENGGRPEEKEVNLFQEWFETNGQSTIDGYLGAMDIISQNSDTLTQTQREEILNNGYNNDEFAGIMNGIANGNVGN